MDIKKLKKLKEAVADENWSIVEIYVDDLLCEAQSNPLETLVSSTVEIPINNDFNGGKIVMDTDIWDALKKFKGITISSKNKEQDIHIAIKE
jgi:hypothetical protein